ncbi:MAG TPA: flagellar basal body-associated FliL family protein [Chloroflexota bacterium]|nr:flagellar basal body-associated FliL family protein [Chloroflexota bacterium]
MKIAFAPALALGILLSACGGSSAPVAQPNAFPNTKNLPTIQIKDRVINLSGKSGYQYAKMTLNVLFADPTGQFMNSKADQLKKLEDSFNADNPALSEAFNDVLVTDVSQKSSQDLGSDQGRETLRQQLIKDFNSRLASGPPVLYIEFVDFVMQ